MTLTETKEVRKHTLGLDRKDNDEFYKIFDEHNDIMEKWNDINKQFHRLKQPVLFLFCYSSKLKTFYKPIEDLQKEFLNWNKKANNFLNKPHFIFSGNQERQLGFLHFTNILSVQINRLNNNMTMIADNFIKIQNNHKNQKNFLIAIFSTFISLCGLALAIYSIYYG